MHWKKIILVILIILMVGFLVWWFVLGQKPSEDKSLSNSDIGEEIDMSDWKLYKNQERGFEFKYPNNWELFEFQSKVELRIVEESYYYNFSVAKIDNPNKLNSEEYSKFWLEEMDRTVPQYPVSYEDERKILIGDQSAHELHGVYLGIEGEPTIKIIFISWPDKEEVYQIQFPIDEPQTSSKILNPKENYLLANSVLSTFKILK